MNLTVDSFIKPKNEFHLKEIFIEWTLNMVDKEDSIIINISGNYIIDTKFYKNILEIEDAPTHHHNYYWPYYELIFTNLDDNKFFSLMANRIVSVDIKDNKLFFDFILHPNELLYGFDLNFPIQSGSALITTNNENLNLLIDILTNNLLIDEKYPIPRCRQCNGLLTIHGQKKSTDIILENDFICADCLKSASNFYKLLYSEILAISDEELKQKFKIFYQYIEGGLKFAAAINDFELKCFYDLILLQIQVRIGNFSINNAETILDFYSEKIKNNNFSKFEKEISKFKNWMSSYNDSKIKKQSLKTVEERAQIIQDDYISQDNLLESSVKIILENKKDQGSDLNANKNNSNEFNLLNGIAEALNTLSTIEENLEPKPITPIDRLKAVSISENKNIENLKPSEKFKSNIPDIEEFSIYSMDLNKKIIESKYDDAWKDVDESIKALDELIAKPDKDSEIKSNVKESKPPLLEKETIQAPNDSLSSIKISSPNLHPPPSLHPPTKLNYSNSVPSEKSQISDTTIDNQSKSLNTNVIEGNKTPQIPSYLHPPPKPKIKKDDK